MKKLIALLALLTIPITSYADFNEADEAFLYFLVGGYASTQIPETDKQLHFSSGAVLGGVGTVVTNNMWWGIGTSAVGGVLKEVFDHNTEGNYADIKDFAYTLVGGVFSSFTVNKLITYDRNKKKALSLYGDKHTNIVMYDINNTPSIGLHINW